ncbi:MAG: hypothetical protein QOI85_674, partial [Chloroflexota bacterium]|nr:hypothetical protein [Chloroflexota bacterium]
ILNPSNATLEQTVIPLLTEAHDRLAIQQERGRTSNDRR